MSHIRMKILNNLQIWVPTVSNMLIPWLLELWELVSASNFLIGFHKVFPWWLSFVFPYSSAGSRAICSTLGWKKFKNIALMSNIQKSKYPLSASNDSLGFHKVFPQICKVETGVQNMCKIFPLVHREVFIKMIKEVTASFYQFKIYGM